MSAVSNSVFKQFFYQPSYALCQYPPGPDNVSTRGHCTVPVRPGVGGWAPGSRLVEAGPGPRLRVSHAKIAGPATLQWPVHIWWPLLCIRGPPAPPALCPAYQAPHHISDMLWTIRNTFGGRANLLNTRLFKSDNNLNLETLILSCPQM